MQALADALLAPDHGALLDFVATLDAKARKAAARWLVADWKGRLDEMRRDTGPWLRRLLALTAVADEPRVALGIPPPHAVRRGWCANEGRVDSPAAARAAIAEAAIAHGRGWCAEYLALLADPKKPRSMEADVMLAIAHAHDLPLPDTAMVAEMCALHFSRRAVRCEGGFVSRAGALSLSRAGGRWRVRGDDRPAPDPLEALRAGLAGEQLGEMLLRVFDHRDVVDLLPGQGVDAAQQERVVDVVTRLIACGVVDAAALARRAIAALARCDSVRAQRLQARLLLAARPGAALVLAQARPLVAALAGGVDTTAKAAQQLLADADADAAGPLPDALFGDVCRAVFARKEKGLRAQQLAWAARRAEDPARAGAAVVGLCEAFANDERGLHPEVVEAIVSAWPRLTSAPRAGVLARVEAHRANMDDAVFRRLWAACAGSVAAGASPGAAGRAAPQRPGLVKRPFERVADPASLPAEVEFVWSLTRIERDAYQFERAVAAAMDALNEGAARLAASLGERLLTGQPHGVIANGGRIEPCTMARLAWARIEELRAAIAVGEPRLFLSVPDFTHGAIAPASLLGRLAQLAQTGEDALPNDFVVALLRTEAPDAPTLAALRALGTREGGIAADFLAAGGASQLRTTRLSFSRWEVPTASWRERRPWVTWMEADREVCVSLSPAAVPPAVPGVPMEWAGGFAPPWTPIVPQGDMVADWITPMLPNHAEALAAMHLWGLRCAGREAEAERHVAERLPLFLQAHGPAGPALHLAVLYCLAANDAQLRQVGSDGLVTLLQQGRLDEALACGLAADCIACGTLKPGRLASSLALVREAGESEAIWPLVRDAIAAALALPAPPHGTPDLVELAIRVAGDIGRKEQVEALAAATAAIRGKPTRLQTQLLRLQTALTA